MGLLERLREGRKGSPTRQVNAPRKARTRREGELSLTEFGAHIGVGPRELRKKLLSLGLLQTEIAVRDRGAAPPKYLHTARLTSEAVRGGLGRRLEPRSGLPYDVLTTKGQEWVADRLHNRATGRKPNRRHEVRDEVRRLLEQRKSRAEISRMMGLSKQLVSYHAKKLAA